MLIALDIGNSHVRFGGFCGDYNGNVIEDRTFNGDWFYFSNSDFGFDDNIVYGGLKSTVSILFNNCLHGIIALPKICLLYTSRCV